MTVTNIHGRKGGRGARPVTLVVKLIGVAMYLGGITAALAIVLSVDPGAVAERWTQLADTLRAIFLFAAVPGLLVAIVCGVTLLVLHKWVLLRMRWMKLKLTILVIVIPTLHLLASGLVRQLREVGAGDGESVIVAQITRDSLAICLAAGAMLTLVVIALGKYKPRLGQRVTTLAEQRAAKADA